MYAAGKAGFIDLDGHEVIPLQYKAGVRFSGGLAAAQKDGKWGYIDTTGKVVIPLQFELPWMFPFQEGLAAVGNFGKGYGFIDTVGTVVIATRFQFTYGFTEGLAAVQVGDKWGYIDPNGALVINAQFDRAYPFSEGLAGVEVKSKAGDTLLGFIQRSGEFVIAPRFTLASQYCNGFCWTHSKHINGYVNRLGEYVWQCPRLEVNVHPIL